MSNTRRAKWSQAEVNAANAEQLLHEAALAITIEAITEDPLINPAAAAGAVRRVIGGRLLADLAAAGHGPGPLAQLERNLAALGDQFWVDIGLRAGLLGPNP